MDSISSTCQRDPSSWNYGDIGESHDSMQATGIFATSKVSKDITIFTDEGDKVTISYDREKQASYENLKALAYQKAISTNGDLALATETSAEVQAENFLFEDSNCLSISLEGDLNEQELKDVKKAINRIDKILADLLYGGDIFKAATEAKKIEGLETIAGVEADYQFETAVTIKQITATEDATYSNSLPEGQETAWDRNGWDAVKNVIDQMTKLVEEADVKPSRMLKPVKELFADILQDLKKDRPGNRARRHLADLIGSELMKRIRQMDNGEKVNVSSSIS